MKQAKMEYYNRKLAEIPADFLKECKDLIDRDFSEELKMEIRSQIDEKGLINWALPHHFGWGMGVRNKFRSHNLLDHSLPSGNWDDYYVIVVEYALGYR